MQFIRHFKISIEFFILYSLIIPSSVYGIVEIKGKVIDSTTKNPVIGANIQVVETIYGTASDEFGEFELTVNKDLPIALKVTHISYETLETTVSTPDGITLELKPSIIKGKVIEVTGVRPLYQADVSADVDLIDTKQIELQGAREVGSALRRVTSVNIDYNNSGKQTIKIRGSNPEEVAVYLDGVKINQANTGVADLSMIDINNLAEIQVIKGGNTTLFGAGNTGGVLNLESRHVERNSLSLKQGNGLTFDDDVDFSAAGTVKRNFLGLGARYTGMTRAYAGRTITTSLFKNVYSDIILPGGILLVKWYELEKALSFPSGGIDLADKMKVSSAKYSGNIPYTGKWEFFMGKRSWINNQDFLSSLNENVTDETETARISKLVSFRFFESTVQYEIENQKFTGDKKQFDVLGNKLANRYSALTKNDNGVSLAARTLLNTENPIVSEVHFEVGLRWDYQAISQLDQFVFTLDSENQNPIVYYKPKVYRYHTTSSRRLGMHISGNNEVLRYSVFVNQGSNIRNPSLLDYFRFSYVSPEMQVDSTLGNEYLHTTEANLNLSLLKPSIDLPINTIDIGCGFFINDYTNKIAHFLDEDGNAIPYNAQSENISGLEGNITLHWFQDIMLIDVGSTYLNISSPIVFPNRPKHYSVLGMEINKGILSIGYDQFYYGKRFVYIPGIGEGYLEPTKNANLSISIQRTYFNVNVILNYSIRNIMSSTEKGDIDLRGFNYFDQYRQIFSIKAEL